METSASVSNGTNPLPNTTDPHWLLAAGRAALQAEDWQRARVLLESARVLRESPELLEALGEVGFWLGDETLTLSTRERAYALYLEQDNPIAAGRIATALGDDYLLFRGAPAIANGWLQVAARLLEDHRDTPEYGWLCIEQANLRYYAFNETATALELARESEMVGRALGNRELIITGQSLCGLVLVVEGRLGEGMALLDGAAVEAIASLGTTIPVVMSISCNLLLACNLARDFERASQWCERFQQYYQERRQELIFCFCRPSFATVLTWKGDWPRAEEQLQTGIRQLGMIRPAMQLESFIRLAELRRLQGAWEESQALLQGAEHDSLALLGQSALALEQGELSQAGQLARRYLRKMEPRLRLERMAALEILLTAQTRLGDLDGAAETMAEIEAIGIRMNTTPMRAAVAAARGRFHTAAGAHAEACADFEDAIDYFQRSGTPYECARVKIDLAQVYRRLQRTREARSEVMNAVAILQSLGATADAQHAQSLLDAINAAVTPITAQNVAPSDNLGGRRSLRAPYGVLTPREVEVVVLVAKGRTNHQIADELVLSNRTVERHISTIYEKLGIGGKAARAAATAWALRTLDSTHAS